MLRNTSSIRDTSGARALTDFHIYTAKSCTRASESYDVVLRQTAYTVYIHVPGYKRTRREYVKNYIYVNDRLAMTGEIIPRKKRLPLLKVSTKYTC
jgi:hypothetical protein